MAAPTFTPPIAPSPGTTRKPEFKLLEAEFGDGYTQSTRNGVNSMRRTLDLSWDFLHPTHAAQITSFLAGQGGVDPFYYTPSDESTPVKWTCKEWDDKVTDGGFRQVTATFKQDFSFA